MTKPKHATVAMSPIKNSSQIESCGHCAKTNTLAVKFKNGGTYHYHDVTADQFTELTKAKSAGSHLRNAFIKTKHKFTKIGD